MTQWTLVLVDGTEYRLHSVLRWEISYGLGTPCDSVQLSCPWAAGQEGILKKATRLRAVHAGETVFWGVVDEWDCLWGAGGCTLELSGRGLQALLLDNEAESADFGVASLSDILEHYVTPFGLALSEEVELPPVQGFSARSGSSCWQVLYQFARYYGGVTPRFDQAGRLLLSPLPVGAARRLDDTLPLTSLALRYRRYGVLSQVAVLNRATMARQVVYNEDFIEKGGVCSRVMTVPRNTGQQSMRYEAQFQLEQSKRRLLTVELCAPLPFLARAGELIDLARAGFGGNGQYRVLEATVSLGEEGYATRLLLGAASLL